MAMFNQFEASANPLMQLQGFDLELHDFIATSNLDQFVDLIRGENDDPVYNGCFADDQFSPSNPGDILDFNGVPGSDGQDFMMFNRLERCDDGEVIKGGEEDDENDGEDSSATTTTVKGGKADRSRTLISERRRRGRMKEKLYALRSLVPNITKMDKASIVGDAVLYVQELQMQARKLKAEIKGIEESIQRTEGYGGVAQNPEQIHRIPRSTSLVPKKITQMDIFQVEERGFYLRIVCEKGDGVARSLYKVLESMKGFNVQSSNLATQTQTFVLTATLNVVKDCEQEMHLPNLKVWLSGALLNQGFEFKPHFPNL